VHEEEPRRNGDADEREDDDGREIFHGMNSACLPWKWYRGERGDDGHAPHRIAAPILGEARGRRRPIPPDRA
jgi:hypothetical protein